MPDHGNYEASTLGRVRSAKTLEVLKPWLRAGYPTVNLRDGPNRKLRSVHTVVAETHIGPRPSGGRYHCAHLDGDRGNSAAANLAWVTPTENEQHKRDHGTYRRGAWSKVRQFTEIEADLIRRIISLGVPQTELAGLLGVAPSTVSNIVRKKFYR